MFRDEKIQVRLDILTVIVGSLLFAAEILVFA